MKKAIHILYITLLILLIGCKKLKWGNVVEKQYNPPYESTQILLMPMIVGKSTMLMPIPYYIWHTESWSIDVKGVSTKGDSMMKTFYISERQYDSTQIGKFICVEGFCDEDTALHKMRQ